MGTGAKVTVICPTCNDPFSVYRYDVEVRGRRYCSSACSSAARRSSCPPKEHLIALYDAGMSTPDLAKHYGVSKGTIYNWFKKSGIQARTTAEGYSLARTGKHNTPEHNAAISAGHIARGSWQGSDHPNFRNRSSWKSGRSRSGRREVHGGLFLRSSWENNYALILNQWIEDGKILRWEYEADRFVFPVKRGNKHYTPDFKVFLPDGSIEYHEVKGFMDDASRIRLRRMALHHPSVKIVLVDKPVYKELAAKYRDLPGWE